ncbi:hypothetical protein [Bacillus pumilus]|uniref:hypothetical protein n=1 Tax=Bacillus pumilus TaxID=1408 RepID=UPI003D713882
MGYVVRVHVGNNHKTEVLTRPILAGQPEQEPWVFDFRDDAAMTARKLRERSSINVWCTIEDYDDTEAV